MKIAVVMFPGNNCENESKRALEAVGLSAEIIRWNTDKDISQYDGYLIPGGWAYEDRIRAGAIAAQDPLMLKIKEEAKKGKPVIGICNGAQVLVESGIIPGLKDKVQMALAPNIRDYPNGFYCTWVHIKSNSRLCKFNTQLNYGEVIPIPIAHGEGRFTTKDKALLEELKKNDQIAFVYSDASGDVRNSYDVNPNSSELNIAAICNKEGNVMAIMPHPERGTWNRQVPEFKGEFTDCESLAPAAKILKAMTRW
ncbi:MAG: phosphoribosylformylglycinamidine synthase I [Nanoarchaeota archaeon]|nr:phosphoribosylformylglycinamidine synthase I [Nanoarchaeota archaeon]MBU1704218.1 phosphoribosylformylglycinamidine synthase I [Nanoarchaeota archaeon]